MLKFRMCFTQIKSLNRTIGSAKSSNSRRKYVREAHAKFINLHLHICFYLLVHPLKLPKCEAETPN